MEAEGLAVSRLQHHVRILPRSCPDQLYQFLHTALHLPIPESHRQTMSNSPNNTTSCFFWLSWMLPYSCKCPYTPWRK